MPNMNPLKWRTPQVLSILALALIGAAIGVAADYATNIENDGPAISATAALIGAFIMGGLGYAIRMTADGD